MIPLLQNGARKSNNTRSVPQSSRIKKPQERERERERESRQTLFMVGASLAVSLSVSVCLCLGGSVEELSHKNIAFDMDQVREMREMPQSYLCATISSIPID